MKKSHSVIGNVIKEEKISLINHHKLPDTLVINIDHPFPGLHGMDFQVESKPRSVIIATSEIYSFAKILRAASKINKNTNFEINASFAKIKAGREVIYGIRIKGLDSYSQIPELQKKWENHGFKLLKRKKIKTEKPVSIKISKFFHLEEITENIYKDVCIKGMFFIEIPEYLSWEDFKKITMRVKNNISNNNFDVVKGLLYKDDTVKDIIRIFKPNIKSELLQEIKKRYYKEMI